MYLALAARRTPLYPARRASQDSHRKIRMGSSFPVRVSTPDLAQRIQNVRIERQNLVTECDVKSCLRGVVKTTQNSVQSCCHPVHAGAVMPRCEATGNVQGKTKPDGKTGLGKGRKGERKRILVGSIVRVSWSSKAG